MATKQDRIAELLAQGLPSSMVASLTATTTSYISQLLAQPIFKDHVKAIALEAAEEETINPEAAEHKTFKDKLKGARALLLDKITSEMHCFAPVETLKAFDIVSKAVEANEKNDLLRKGLSQAGAPSMVINGQVVQNVVNIHMPVAVVPDIEYGPNKEILAIGGRTTGTLPSSALQKLLDEHMEGLPSGRAFDRETVEGLYAPIQNS